jgi:hypothetical protein
VGAISSYARPVLFLRTTVWVSAQRLDVFRIDRSLAAGAHGARVTSLATTLGLGDLDPTVFALALGVGHVAGRDRITRIFRADRILRRGNDCVVAVSWVTDRPFGFVRRSGRGDAQSRHEGEKGQFNRICKIHNVFLYKTPILQGLRFKIYRLECSEVFVCDGLRGEIEKEYDV